GLATAAAAEAAEAYGAKSADEAALPVNMLLGKLFELNTALAEFEGRALPDQKPQIGALHRQFDGFIKANNEIAEAARAGKLADAARIDAQSRSIRTAIGDMLDSIVRDDTGQVEKLRGRIADYYQRELALIVAAIVLGIVVLGSLSLYLTQRSIVQPIK